MSLKRLTWLGGCSSFFYFILFFASCFAQQEMSKKDQYILTPGQKLQIVVHIWGEVNRPGQYLVPDGTNVLELISLAGGPTEFSKLSNVKLTRESIVSKTQQVENKEVKKDENIIKLVDKKIIKINLKKYLERDQSESLPILKPGDVIKIKKNLWSRWQTLVRVVSQIAIVVQLMYFYSRIDL